jgi:hypothetical protein
MKKIVPVFPWPMHAKVAEEFAKLENITPVEALPGGPGPVLAIRSAPTFVCDAVVVLSPERVAEGVHIVTGDGIELVLMRQMMGATGEYIEDRTAKVRFE